MVLWRSRLLIGVDPVGRWVVDSYELRPRWRAWRPDTDSGIELSTIRSPAAVAGES